MEAVFYAAARGIDSDEVRYPVILDTITAPVCRSCTGLCCLNQLAMSIHLVQLRISSRCLFPAGMSFNDNYNPNVNPVIKSLCFWNPKNDAAVCPLRSWTVALVEGIDLLTRSTPARTTRCTKRLIDC